MNKTTPLEPELPFEIDGPNERVRIIRWKDGSCQPASDAEIALWDALARALSSRLPPDWVAVPTNPDEQWLRTVCEVRRRMVGASAKEQSWWTEDLRLYVKAIAAAPSLQPMPKQEG